MTVTRRGVVAPKLISGLHDDIAVSVTAATWHILGMTPTVRTAYGSSLCGNSVAALYKPPAVKQSRVMLSSNDIDASSWDLLSSR